MSKVFLDTSVVLGALLGISKAATGVFNDDSLELHISEYVLKEICWVMRDNGFSEYEIGLAVDLVRERCLVLPAPRKEEFRNIRLRDRSDAPVVCSARKYGLVLYTDDEKTGADAREYVEVKMIRKDRKKHPAGG